MDYRKEVTTEKYHKKNGTNVGAITIGCRNY